MVSLSDNFARAKLCSKNSPSVGVNRGVFRGRREGGGRKGAINTDEKKGRGKRGKINVKEKGGKIGKNMTNFGHFGHFYAPGQQKNCFNRRIFLLLIISKYAPLGVNKLARSIL